jgi:hemolysin III
LCRKRPALRFTRWGIVFYLNRKIPHNHAIRHLFALSAAICHYVAGLLAVVLPVM